MKYYSEELHNLYDSKEDCLKAEKEARLKIEKENTEKAERAARRKAKAAEVEAAMDEMNKARTKYAKALEEFTKEFGSYHFSVTGDKIKDTIPTLFDIFNTYLF